MNTKRTIKYTLLISAAIILAVVAFLFGKPLYYRLYLGSRIKGTITVMVDNEVYDLNKDQFSFEKGGRVHIKKDKSAVISIHGGEKCDYPMEIADTPMGKPLTICFGQLNWWNVTRFDMTISIDTAANEVSVDAEGDELKEDGNKTSFLYSKSYNYLEEDRILFSISQ